MHWLKMVVMTGVKAQAAMTGVVVAAAALAAAEASAAEVTCWRELQRARARLRVASRGRTRGLVRILWQRESAKRMQDRVLPSMLGRRLIGLTRVLLAIGSH